MTPSYDKNAAVVALPALSQGWLADRELRQWLSQGNLSFSDIRASTLSRALAEIGSPAPVEGLAALRMWGQTGDRPTAWIAAADPVYLEPRMDHLWLHALAPPDLGNSEFGTLVDHLQRSLGGDSGYGFARLGSCGYLTAAEPIATATLPASVLHLSQPDRFLPGGVGAGSHRGLTSEIEMALHEHPLNVEREASGRRPVNSLWLWGGGRAPGQETVPHPPLFSDDALLAGYWRSKTGLAEPWPGSIDDCLSLAVAGFVATPAAPTGDAVEQALGALRDALSQKRFERVVLLFADGLRAELRRSHALRIWRREHPLLEPHAGRG